MASYYEVLTAAINDLVANGFDSVERVRRWQAELARAARDTLVPEAELDRQLRLQLGQVYQRYVEQGAVLDQHRGVPRWAFDRVKPQLRAELDRRVMASADLIRLNRDQMVARTLQRFSGWATSLPPGGPSEPDKRRHKAEIRKPLARLPFEERRVMIDQGAKLVNAVSSTVALGSGALAARWRHVHQAGYDARPDHLARDGEWFLVRDCWAIEQGLVRPGAAPYTDEVEQPAELPYCRCTWAWEYGLRSLPADWLTKKGRDALDASRALMEA